MKTTIPKFLWFCWNHVNGVDLELVSQYHHLFNFCDKGALLWCPSLWSKLSYVQEQEKLQDMFRDCRSTVLVASRSNTSMFSHTICNNISEMALTSQTWKKNLTTLYCSPLHLAGRQYLASEKLTIREYMLLPKVTKPSLWDNSIQDMSTRKDVSAFDWCSFLFYLSDILLHPVNLTLEYMNYYSHVVSDVGKWRKERKITICSNLLR